MSLNYPSAGIPLHSRRANILLVEDNDDHWFVIKSALLESWPSVNINRRATDHETLAYLDQQGNRLPDLILLDLYLPGRAEGWKLLKTLKIQYPSLPVVMLSYSDQPEDILECYDLRGNAYMTKPTSYKDWLTCFEDFRRYWSEFVTLPSH